MNTLKHFNKSADSPESPPSIPPELWTLIFEHLSTTDLSRARLVCRHWNELIRESASLVTKFDLKLLEKTLGPESDPIRGLVASSTIRFSRVSLHGERFLDAGTWWPQIGQNLQALDVKSRTIDISDLLELLRETPKLKILKFSFYDVTGENIVPQINFQLSSLEVLEMETDCPDLLHMFREICPRLKEILLKIATVLGLEPNLTSQDVIDFIRTARNTLERVSVSGIDDSLLEELINLEGSRLKRISVACSDTEYLNELSSEQASVEELRVNICSDETLCKVGTALPNLKALSCGFSENQSSTVRFLSCMPKLRRLSIASQSFKKCDKSLNFPLLKHHELERLTMRNGKQTLCWIEYFPNLRTLQLLNCEIHSWPNFYAAIAPLKALKTVQLKCVKALQRNELSEVFSTNIEHLNVICCDFSKDFLATLTSSCPNLAEIHLGNMQIVGDDTVLAVCNSSARLKSLSLYGLSNVTCQSVKTIAEYCPQLDKVSFVECHSVRNEAVEVLRKTKIYKVFFEEMVAR